MSTRAKEVVAEGLRDPKRRQTWGSNLSQLFAERLLARHRAGRNRPGGRVNPQHLLALGK